MKVLVCGSRDWTDPWEIEERLPHLPRGTEIIHGDCRGADRVAATVAGRLGFQVTAYPADWRGKGKRAGILRNLEMLDQKPDLVIAFQKAGSTGTQHTIDEATRRGIPVEVFRV